MSACAMVLLPGLDKVSIHRTAHIAVHGITMMDYRTWFGWLRDDAAPSAMDLLTAQMGVDLDFVMHKSGQDHMREHLNGQNVDLAYIQSVNERMTEAAQSIECRVDPKDYWGMLDAEHLRTYLGERIDRMEPFAQSWADPNNGLFKSISVPIATHTYIFNYALVEAGCD